VGRIAVDERRVHHVHTKFDGYVERLHVDFTGKRVRRGEALMEIFSPELVATQEEYLLALRARDSLGGSGLESVAGGAASLLEAARRRLLLWDVAPADVAELERTGQVRRTLPLHAEMGGWVIAKNVVDGQRVTPADTLLDVADLSHLWVLADVYESDLSAIRLGMQGEVRVTYLPERTWRGPVTWISPTVEEATRTVKVRLEVDNASGDLRPDMFTDVYLAPGGRRALVVPESAVIDTGERRLVFLDRGEGRFEPREVRLAPRAGDVYPVAAGLEAGDLVVVSANFLLDSESSLQAAVAALGDAGAGGHRH
jgi:Cu(I)/Ag(I) efflux system membrane fusion protein